MVMAINARWKGQGSTKQFDQVTRFDVSRGRVGHLWELYHPYVTRALVLEAFERGEAQISAALMRERLPEVVALIKHQGLVIDEESELVRGIIDFIDFC